MLTQREVADQLRPITPVLVDAHMGAAARLQALHNWNPALVAAMNPTERANFFHAQIRDLVSVGVEPIEGVQVTKWNVFSLAVGTDLLVRFKYLGNGKPANVATEQQVLLSRQSYTAETLDVLAQAGILRPPTTVTCGYTLNGLDLAQVLVRRDHAACEPWVYSVHPHVAVTEPLVLPGVEQPKPARVRSKRATAEQLGETGTDQT
jgi:hypothetical protein